MNRRGVLLLATLLASLAAPLAPANADCHSQVSEETCAATTNGGFGIGQGQSDGPANDQPGTTVGVAAPLSPEVTRTRYVPTCTGNTPEGGDDALCGAAVESCPDEAEIRMWVYTARFNRTSGEQVSDWQLVTDSATRCVGADDPVLDPTVAIPAIVQRDFKRVVVAKGVAEVSPRPDTLVNIPTVFSTSTPQSYDIPLTLLGQSVVITAKAERWTWHFGDGQSATSTQAPDGRVEHEYTRSGERQAYVVIEWSGTFRINGGAPQDITGAATTTGDPVTVAVKQARSQLVDG